MREIFREQKFFVRGNFREGKFRVDEFFPTQNYRVKKISPHDSQIFAHDNFPHEISPSRNFPIPKLPVTKFFPHAPKNFP